MPDRVIVQIALDIPIAHTFSYLAPQPLPQGQRVKVPFGSRHLCGIVVDEPFPHTIALEKLKPVLCLLSGAPPLPLSFFAIVRFAAAYYHYPFGQTIFTALPTSLRQPKNVVLSDQRAYALTPSGRETPPKKRHAARYRVWSALAAGPAGLIELRALASQVPRLLSHWIEQGWVERIGASIPAKLYVASAPPLNTEQQVAVEAIVESLGRFSPWVLQGITGSGKTEVYLRAIEAVLRREQQVLVLVPEINLTPQLVARFVHRFPTTALTLLHSQLGEGERLRAWYDAWQGNAAIILGTRLSIFVPLPSLGLIIVDEEHDDSFKQQDGLRYQARDLALWKAKQHSVPVVLGSATPSLETMARLFAGRHQRLTLRQRAHQSSLLPAIHLIDTRYLKRVEGLAVPAIDALRYALARREMSLVYINRRGFAPILICTDCGWVSPCPYCSARLVLHLRESLLRCHHCGREETLPNACPVCGNVDIKPLGEGTQRLEAGLLRLFPEARVLRVDRDTTQYKDAWSAFYEQVQRGEVDILVGTQMLAKGHDFGSLSLVVVLNADSGLYSVDYRSSECLFSQLTQVAGRAGRAGIPGKVLIQTQWPQHPLYQTLIANDFDGFCTSLLLERQRLGFPPATYQAVVRADAPSLQLAGKFLEDIRIAIDGYSGDVLLLGPAPALMRRIANRERAQLILESKQRHALHVCLIKLVEVASMLSRQSSKKIRWSLDVDPQGF